MELSKTAQKILDAIKKGGMQSHQDISKATKVPVGTVGYHMNQLKHKGLISSDGDEYVARNSERQTEASPPAKNGHNVLARRLLRAHESFVRELESALPNLISPRERKLLERFKKVQQDLRKI